MLVMIPTYFPLYLFLSIQAYILPHAKTKHPYVILANRIDQKLSFSSIAY